MGSKLEQIGISERAGLITPNLYKQDWTVPSNTNNNYSVVHTRAKSDSATPIYGKGTGVFLDTTNGGGSYDINGNTNYVGSGRLNAISINTAQWSYGPTTPYSVTNTRALSDATTPVYGKGTGVFLDTANGGGSYDINGKSTYPGSGRVPLMNYNYSIWTFGPSNNYRMSHPHALGPTTIPTALNLLKVEGGNGDVLGKGTNDGMGIDGTLVAHMNYAGGSWDDIISRDRNIYKFNNLYFVDVTNPLNENDWYTKSHKNALAPIPIQPDATDLLTSENGNGDIKGKGRLSPTTLNFAGQWVLPAHYDYGGGSWDDIISRKRNIYTFGNLYWVTGSEYDLNHPNAKSTGDNRGKGTNSSNILDASNSFVLPAHINYTGGSSDDIAARNSSINNPFNLYKVDVSNPLSNNNNTWYTMSHPNALANGDNKGKGTNDGIGFDGTFAAHMNYNGGSNIDINGNPIIIGSGRIPMNTKNKTTDLTTSVSVANTGLVTVIGNKPFGYGYGTGEGYDSSYPVCADAANTINVGQIKW